MITNVALGSTVAKSVIVILMITNNLGVSKTLRLRYVDKQHNKCRALVFTVTFTLIHIPMF